MPVRESLVLVIISTCATAAMLDRASPLNPRLTSRVRSLSSRILLVACRSNALVIWLFSMPQPLSVTRIIFFPPSRISTVMAVAPASMEFSTSSFTTFTGLSTTSPAAIRFIVSSLSK